MRAWVTLLTKPSYVEGVITLQRSLRQCQSRYPLAVMITDAIDTAARRRLTDEGCRLHEVEPLTPSPGVEEKYANARFAEVWTKLAAWRLTEYARLVFLDADMLAIRSLDEVFDIALPADWIAACHACRCNPYHIASYPSDWVPANCYYSYLPVRDNVTPPADLEPYFNSGFILLTPNQAIADDLKTLLSSIRNLDHYPFPEQDLLNDYFRRRWQPLPYIYNALKTLSVQHPRLWNFDEVKNLHFILSKPWEENAEQPAPDEPYGNFNQLWRDIHDGRSGPDHRE
ncbi:glycosyltransferase family 8 protein [Martelella alba]|uniref:Glycosyltransferase family 8 protein n=1 Tax=Martelella alba TaxID=2590451 RepID=A0ABY2SNB8_9HYPH|nr:glycosyltransferase family 8 protein [Martelella alba]TKI06565.1 glycosyltransferase family 8 protein [Martelella alba]